MTTLSTPTVLMSFPAGTQDTPWNFHLTGTNPDGSDYDSSFDSDQPSAPAPDDLQVGATVTLVVTKNGVSSLPSDPFVVPGPPVMLSVPDASAKAVISA